MGKKRLVFTLKAWPAVFGITVALSYLTELFAKHAFGVEFPEQAQVQVMRDLFKSGNVALIAVNLVLVLLAMPAIEEVLFRWITRFGMWLWAPMAAAFSLAHYIDYGRLAANGEFAFTGWNGAFLALFLFGLCQSWIYRKTGRLWCAMLNHALFNTTNLVLLFIIPA